MYNIYWNKVMKKYFSTTYWELWTTNLLKHVSSKRVFSRTRSENLIVRILLIFKPVQKITYTNKAQGLMKSLFFMKKIILKGFLVLQSSFSKSFSVNIMFFTLMKRKLLWAVPYHINIQLPYNKVFKFNKFVKYNYIKSEHKVCR